MTKKYCDKCKKVLTNGSFSSSYENRTEGFEYYHLELCEKCFRSVKTLKDLKKLDQQKRD